MTEIDLDHRTGVRFQVPGADVSYSVSAPLLPLQTHKEDACPLIDISRGGILFTSRKPLKVKTRLSLNLHLPEEEKALSLKGYVIWIYPDTGKSSRYETGVRFNSYGRKRGQNPAHALIKIIDLEKKWGRSPKGHP